MGFRQHADLKPSDPKVAEELHHAQDVATILKQNVVQGKKEGDTYSTFSAAATVPNRMSCNYS